MKRFWRAWVRFVSTDESLSALLLLLIIVSLVLPPLTAARMRQTLLSDLFFSLLLASGLAAMWSEGQRVFRSVAGVTLISLVARWWAWFASSSALASWSEAADMIALACFALVVLAKVVRAGTITRHRIQGAVAVYLLFGLAWAHAYAWTAITHPGAFSRLEADDASWLYYSFVTLTTVGYGDITPVHPLSRSLAAAEALTGQLYLAILVARLIALEIASRKLS